MNTRVGSGWQYVMTDLSLILFMITAAALGSAPPDGPPPPPPAALGPAALPALGEPVAVWRAAPDAPPLATWLASQGADPQLRLTVVAPQTEAQAALSLAASAGRPARVLIEPDASGAPFATLTYDQAAPLAQGLHVQPGQAGNAPAAKE